MSAVIHRERDLAVGRAAEQLVGGSGHDHGSAHPAEWSLVNTKVKDALNKFYYDKTKRRPMILPFMVQV